MTHWPRTRVSQRFVTPEMELMRREIFGPIPPILTYGELREAVDTINARDRPLALYPLVGDAATRRF
jgi:coniferyl-aldehyde dehydrogenase